MATASEDERRPPSLTERMRSATRQVHDKSDRLVNLKLALVLTSPSLYGEALSLFLPVYERIELILERLCRRKEDRAGGQYFEPFEPLLKDLRRGPGFREDFAFYVSSDRRKELETIRSGEGKPEELAEYLRHLSSLEKNDPVRLLAYVYHMYMAIFAGGYIIKKTVIKAMGLPRDGTEGVRTFSFDGDGPTAKQLSRELKRILNEEISLSEEETGRVIEEGAEVFRRNNALVSTVKGTGAWSEAAGECSRRVTRVLLVSVSLMAAALMTARVLRPDNLLD